MTNHRVLARAVLARLAGGMDSAVPCSASIGAEQRNMVAQDQEKPRQMTRWPLVLLDGRLQWRITKPAKGADAITDDVRRLRAEMLAAGVQLIADNRSLLIVAPANWTRAELPLLVAHVGAVLDLLHVQSDQRLKIQAISEPVQSGCAGSD